MTNHEAKINIDRHVVLVAPEVHWNTGNIGRTCLGVGACLHLIKPLGFSIESKEVKRAGLDYWSKVKLFIWEDFDTFFSQMSPEPEHIALFSKSAKKSFWLIPPKERLFLIFGSETQGLPQTLLNQYESDTYHIPITNDIRCLNLSTSVGVALYESLRPFNRDSDFHHY